MKVFVVDDDREVGEVTAMLLGDLGYDTEAIDSLAAARARLGAVVEPFVVVLDHNFEGEDEVGYDLCRDLRLSHPYGLLLPIIYRTGKETMAGYVQRESEDLNLVPTAFVDKLDDAARLGVVVDRCVAQFDRLTAVLAEQSVRQAVMELGESEPEFLDPNGEVASA